MFIYDLEKFYKVIDTSSFYRKHNRLQCLICKGTYNYTTIKAHLRNIHGFTYINNGRPPSGFITLGNPVN